MSGRGVSPLTDTDQKPPPQLKLPQTLPPESSDTVMVSSAVPSELIACTV